MLNVINAQESLKLRKELLKKLKLQVQMHTGTEPLGLRRYALSYKKRIERSRWNLSSREELLASLKESDIVYGGDFHAYAQAQKSHRRLLSEIAGSRPFILALECIESRHQKTLDAFIAGKCSEEQFLKKVRWDQSWGFSWQQYRPLLELVKVHGGRCLALNIKVNERTGKTLRQRDLHAAQLLAGALKLRKNKELIYVVYGDLHVAKEKIPDLVRKSSSIPIKDLMLYLNPEKIYFQLVHKNMEHKSNVLKFSKNEFCLVESPPWVKWQSYLLYLEENVDQQLASEDSQLDYSEHVQSLVNMLATDLSVKIKKEPTLRSYDDDDFLEILKEKVPQEDYQCLKQLVGGDLTFYYPDPATAFLSRGTVNHAAHLAGLILQAQLSGRKRWLNPGSQDFPALIWTEAVAFALSKMINPHRKSLSLGDLKKQLAAFSPKDNGEESLKLALDQKMRELLWVYGGDVQKTSSGYVPRSSFSYYRAAKILGGILGQNLFLLLKAGRLSRSQWMAWLGRSVEDEKFSIFYIQVLREVDKMGLGASE